MLFCISITLHWDCGMFPCVRRAHQQHVTTFIIISCVSRSCLQTLGKKFILTRKQRSRQQLPSCSGWPPAASPTAQRERGPGPARPCWLTVSLAVRCKAVWPHFNPVIPELRTHPRVAFRGRRRPCPLCLKPLHYRERESGERED